MASGTIITCPSGRRAEAIRQLLAARQPSQQLPLTAALDAARDAGDSAWQGLLAAVVSDEIAAAVWVQPMAGNTAVIWPPGPENPHADLLLRSAAQHVDEYAIGLSQLIIGDHEGFEARRLAECGFAKLLDLLYLSADVAQSTQTAALHTEESDNRLEFLPHAADDPVRLAALIEQSYENTQDCPVLDGVRSTADVIAGYRAQGRYMSDQWYIVRQDGNDVGVLILADHPAAGNWELVYMGVAPRARGRRLGDAIVAFAKRRASVGGAERLVLGVDAANEPARAAYARANFVEWDRRCVFARGTGLNSPPVPR